MWVATIKLLAFEVGSGLSQLYAILDLTTSLDVGFIDDH